MVGSFTLIAISIKAQSGIPFLLAALTNVIVAERVRQYEVVRELGTLASRIEDRKLLGQNSSALQKQYDELATLLTTRERG
jgi:hypothetical protein